MATVDDYLTWKKEISNKPATPIGGSGSVPIFTPNGGQGIVEGPTNRPIGEGSSGAVDKNGNVIDKTTRVGDYVYSQGRSYVVPNSVTDLNLKNIVSSGASGVPASTSPINLGAALSGATTGSIAGGIVAGKTGSVIGGIGGALLGNVFGTVMDAQRAQKEWREQQINYDTAVSFYTDKNGKLKYHLDYNKMAEAGDLSSANVIQMQNQETEVKLGDDGHLKVKVSPIFAATKYYDSIVNEISKDYAGLNKNSDDLDQKLADIQKRIESAKNNYLANTISYAAYKANFPDASDAAIIAGYTTSFAGNADPKDMKDYTVFTVSDGEIKEQNADEFFDSFLNMSMDDRNNFVKGLIQEISNKDTDDDAKAVAYGELQALYSVSANKFGYKDDKYEGMMDAEWLVTFWNQFQILDNVFLGDGRQEYLNQNEYAKNIGMLSSAGAQMYLHYKGMQLTGKLISKIPGGRALFNASLAGDVGQGAAYIAAAQGSKLALLKTAAAGVAFNTTRSAIFNAALSGVRVATGEDSKQVWEQYAKNVAFDTALGLMMQYYDVVKFKATVTDTTKFVYKDAKTGDIQILETDRGKNIVDVDIDGNVTSEYESVGQMSFAKTSGGTEVGYATNGDVTLYKYGDKVYVVGKDGNATSWTGADGAGTPPAALNNGIVMEGGTELTNKELIRAAQDAGLKPGTEIIELPSKDAYSAVAAGKFVGIEGSKVGLKVNEALFSVNASLDYVNDRALAKTGDRTAWQNATETFANIQQLSGSLKQDILSGKFYKPVVASHEAYVKSYGDFTSRFGGMTKADSLYTIAKESIARAQIGQKTIGPDSGVNLVAEAIEKNGKYLSAISPERAEALDRYVEANKQYLKDFVIAVKKSGYVDGKQLDNAMHSDISREIGYIPMWSKKESYNSLLNQYYLVDQEKTPVKSWHREGEILDAKDLLDFTVSTSRLEDFFATNMALSYRNQVLIDQLDGAGMLVDNTISTEKQRRVLLGKVENYDELKAKLTKMSNDAKKYVDKHVPSPAQYNDMMLAIYRNSGVEHKIEAIDSTPDDDLLSDGGAGSFDEIKNIAGDIVRKSSEYNKQFGRSVDIDGYIETTLNPAIDKAVQSGDKDAIRSAIVNGQFDVAPYTDKSGVLKTKLEGVASDWRKWAEKNIKTTSEISSEEKTYAIDAVAAEINGTTVDGFEMGAAKRAAGLGKTYPVTCYQNGRPYTRYIKVRTEEERRVAERIEHIINDKQLIMKRGVVSQAARSIANGFRTLTTGWDPSRVPPNLVRDTVRGEVSSGGVSFTTTGANQIFKDIVSSGNYTDEQKQMLSDAFDNVAEKVAGDTYNAAYGSPSKAHKDLQREYYQIGKKNAPNKFVKYSYDIKNFTFNLTHSPQKIFEAPGNFFEGYTRKRLAKSAFVNALEEARVQGKSFDEQYKAAEYAANFAGHEYTSNFGRKGRVVGEISQYVAYFSTNFANVDGFKRAYINNPKGVSTNFAIFLIGYMFLLGDTLSNEKTRKNYYRLTDYDRSNSIVVSLDDGTLLTVPLDETLAGLIFPFRRILETMHNVDPVSFYELMWGTLTEPLPIDMSGFSEGDYFNFRRGMEKIISSAAPTWATGLLEAATGYDLYYGSSNEVTEESLKQQGIYDPQPGDFTTKSKNSATLREISNATGIPQWQLQSLLKNYGGNVGQYVIGTIDKLSGASEDAQGGKDFFDAVFKNFVATDYDSASSEFYNVVNGLKKEKKKLQQKLSDLNESMETASGDALYKLQNEYQKAKDDYAVVVGDAVNKYLNAYEITGGLTKSQAMQVYYLFNLEDDDSFYMKGSVGDYFNEQAENASYDEATRTGASILDKYYDQSVKPYLDSSGTWRISPSYGEKAYYNTVYGQGVKYEVDLRNLLEKGDDSLKDARSKMYDERSKAADAKNWDLYDNLGYEYDKKVLERIAPYIKRNGAYSVLTNSTAMDYLEKWIVPPSDFMVDKRGRHVSLGHDASKSDAFRKPYIKYLFGLDTGARADYNIDRAKLEVRGQ